MENISQMTLNLPSTLSPQAYRLLTGLLCKDPGCRLGSQGSEEVKSHEFFDGVDWEAVFNKEKELPKPPKRVFTRPPRYEEVFGYRNEQGSRKIEGFTWISC